MDTGEKILFVVNPVAGGKDKSLFWASLAQVLDASPFDFLTYPTTGEDDVQQLRQLLNTHPFTRVIIVGGDGTVKLAAEQLVHQSISLGIIPMGSANGMARELGIPSQPKEALRIALGDATTRIDAIHVEGHGLCIHLSDLGLNATLIENYQANRLRGMWGYGRVLLRTFLQRTRFRIYLVNDQLRLNRHVYMVMLANARMFGTGALINPTGSLQDGLFEVVMIKDIRWWDFPRLFFANRKQYQDREEVVSVTSISIDTRRPVHFQMDGEYKGKISHLKAHIIPQGLRVLTPTAK